MLRDIPGKSLEEVYRLLALLSCAEAQTGTSPEGPDGTQRRFEASRVHATVTEDYALNISLLIDLVVAVLTQGQEQQA